ncbi:amino acid adenylation domain-containing protein [Fulvivirga maritima]|uniref:non-ribosomal peptide synthetase n=1 Tax=Fulvivirga maritima TaxID=2904247 RepID=UPI001F4901DD|nr:non-ribosomal peptide synthetase [Fulvivirga maritima]UII24657.1 amino acid adenylation domain-containing protein [Fulvivirga maritima]
MPRESMLNKKQLEANKNLIAKSYWKRRFEEFQSNTYFEGYRSQFQDSEENEVSLVIEKSFSNILDQVVGSPKGKHLLLLAAFGVFVQKCTSLSDVCILTPVYQEYKESYDINHVIPVRINKGGEFSFSEFLGYVKRTFLEDLKFGNYPLERILGLSLRDLGLLSSVGILVDNVQDEKPLDVISTDLKFIFNSDIHLKLNVKYNNKKFDESYVKVIAELFLNFVTKLLSNSNIPLAGLELISEQEKEMVLRDFNNTKEEYPKDVTLDYLFEKQVADTPDNIALIFKDQQLTYLELNQRANQLARKLKTLGAKKGEVIGIVLDRSMESIISILAVLKMGGVYLPIDIEQPENRLREILSSSGIKFLVADNDLNSRFLDNILFVDSKEIISNDKSNLNGGHSSLDLAYIISTSGTTGTPKGVMVTHKNVINLIYHRKRVFNICEKDRVLQFSNLSFDASVEQIWLSFLSGAGLVLISSETIIDNELFNKYIKAHHVTHLDTTPSFLNSIELDPNNNLKRIIIGGEECNLKLARELSNQYDLYNEYGTTETTVTSVAVRVTCPDLDTLRVPIGKPIGNTQVYILNEQMCPLPVGIKGEMYIAGDGVALGYMNNSILTSQRFLKNPFSNNGKLYKTGDVARWMPDGNIEYFGRIDKQVKIRGFRVELKDIEDQLLNHPNIKSAVVCLYGEELSKYLAAYYVSDSDLDEAQLKEFLTKRIPGYMVPSHIVQLFKMPLTISGKVDDRNLPEPKLAELKFEPPENEIEKSLTQIWAGILKIEKNHISATHNFFDIGGHSLRATMLVNQINKHFSTAISLKEVFEKTTIRQQADLVKINSWLNDSNQENDEKHEITI